MGLADRLVGLLVVQLFLNENPSLDQGSRKLSGRVKDHINREGEYDPRGVGLELCFMKGAQQTTAALTEHGMFSADKVNYAGLDAAGATLLSPFPGKDVKVGFAECVQM